MSQEEKERLESIANNSLYARGANADTIKYSYRILKRFLVQGSILELGPAEGLMTDEIVKLGRQTTCVDGSGIFCDNLKKRYPSLEVVNSLFENYKPDKTFNNIVLGHVLEHVEDPEAVLEQVKSWLSPKGIIFAAVPNARSIHRQAAVIMGLLESENQLNDMDIHHGHRRVFDPESYRKAFLKASLHIEYFGGYWLKPISNYQIEQYWDDKMLEAFMILGERYPDIAGEIYVVASH